MISVEDLAKHFGPVRAVDGVSFTARPGMVTGFLGPNGAGKTTTLRMLLGLVAPTSGTALINGRPYTELERPVMEVGAALEATGFHPGRSARDHLTITCAAAGIPRSRVPEVLELTGLADAADRRVVGFSLGMRQRLALAGAILGEPKVLILDEPANGLDPAGVHWLRTLLRHLAGIGCTILVSSHVLPEVEQTADHVVIVARGRLVRDAPLADLVGGELRIRTGQAGDLAVALENAGGEVRREGDLLWVSGVEPEEVGRAALHVQAVLAELARESSGLEKIFLDLTMAELNAPAVPDGPPPPPGADPSVPDGPAGAGDPAGTAATAGTAGTQDANGTAGAEGTDEAGAGPGKDGRA